MKKSGVHSLMHFTGDLQNEHRKAVINCYRSRSVKEFWETCENGPNLFSKPCAHADIFPHTPNHSYDQNTWEFLKNRVPYANVDFKLGDRNQLRPTKYAEAAVICLAAKNEEAYIDQFVDYHIALRFSHIFPYDNTNQSELLQWASEKGNYITHKRWEPGRNQSEAMQDCVRTYVLPENHTWVAVLWR